MPVIAEVRGYQDELTAIRRDIHAHPELAFAERRTSDLVAKKLAEFGCEIHRGLAGTGVVGTIRRGNSPAAIGLRADMDALPIQEMNEFAHRSANDGKMHACGHDGHTTMLLGAARYLAATRNFEGAVHLIFQPAEEGGGGGRVMVEEGLFEKFPCDAVFALHNKPGIAVGQIAAKAGPLLAASDRWDIRITGHGTHAAHPHFGIDPFVVGAEIVLALQTIVSRSVDPLEAAVVSVGFINGGSAYNVIPDGCTGRHRAQLSPAGAGFDRAPHRRDRPRRRRYARSHGRNGLPALLSADNQPPGRDRVRRRDRTEICGPDMVLHDVAPSMGGEDFSFMLKRGRGRCCGSATAPAKATAFCTMPATISTTKPCRSASAFWRASPSGFSQAHPVEIHSAPRPSSRRARIRCGRSIMLPSSAAAPASGFPAKRATTRRAQASSSAPTGTPG